MIHATKRASASTLLVSIVASGLAIAAGCTAGDARRQPGSTQEALGTTSGNIIRNGSFENGAAPWTLDVSGGAAATFAVDCSTSSGTNTNRWSERLSVAALGSDGAWDAQLRHTGLSLSSGQSITVTFAAMSRAARTLEAGVQQLVSPWRWYSLEQFSLPGDSAWHTYTWSFTQNATDGSAALNVDFGQTTGDVWIDDVIVTANGGHNLVSNGSFESGSSSWTLLVGGAASASSAVDCSTSLAGPADRWSAKIDATTLGRDGAWDVSLRQSGLALGAGSQVSVSFDARSTTARTVEAGVQQLVSPWTWYSLRSFDLPGDSAWHTYSWTYTQPSTDSGVGFNYDVGQATGSVWIDDVSVSPCAGCGGAADAGGTVEAGADAGAPACGSVHMNAPPGYAASQLVWDESFCKPTLDTTKWNPWIGDTYGRWSDQGLLPFPYSGVNDPSTTFQIQYDDPYPAGFGTNTTGAHTVTGNGLRLIASPSNYFSNLGYSWASGGISTHGLFYWSGGYAQFKAKMPDSRHGMWAGLWFLEGGAEMDLNESGYFYGSSGTNNVLASHWWQGNQIIQDVGTDLSAGYHVYGIEYIPGTSFTVFLDGVQKAQWTQNVATGAYEVLIDLEVGGPNVAGWHTVADAVNYPGPYELDVQEMQVYGR